MKVAIYGATGMVGQGVLRECLLDPEVDEVFAVGRTLTGQQHPKLRELPLSSTPDPAEREERSEAESRRAGVYDPAEREERSEAESRRAGVYDVDACFFCLGVTSAGMKEADYRRITYDLTMDAARPMAERNPKMTFIYVSGVGTDSTEKGRTMWARVKGKTENDLLALPFQAYMFRPGYIHPMHGIKSKTRLYAALYKVAVPLYPVLRRLAPKSVTTTENIGRAMLNIAKRGSSKRILEPSDINALAQ